mmetsp:Transcript_74787/g.217090  ORF Transcript_74787/g.217090 Transcript_74787/m.217090 type:complete len:493 (-) Transcript_74787:121-1599(-)
MSQQQLSLNNINYALFQQQQQQPQQQQHSQSFPPSAAPSNNPSFDSHLLQLYQNFTSSMPGNNLNNSNGNSNGSQPQQQQQQPSMTNEALLEQYRMLLSGNQNNNAGSHLPDTTQSNQNSNNDNSGLMVLSSKMEPLRDNQGNNNNNDWWGTNVFDDDAKLNLSINPDNVQLMQLQQQQQALEQQQQQQQPQPQAFFSDPEPALEPAPVDDFGLDVPFILPSTMIPPSVLAMSSSGSYSGSNKRGNKNAGGNKRKRLKPLQPTVTPQAHLEQLLQGIGFPYNRLTADEAEYDAVPSALQLASFGTQLVKAVHTTNTSMLRELLACGLSPNPCNQFRDSILDLVCKRANEPIFQVLLENGADLQVVDGFGRTPLHHACWASEFCAPIVESILARDPIQLAIEDKHGQTPLEYVRADLYEEWIQFLSQSIHRYYGHGRHPQWNSPKPGRPEGALPDPPNAISVSLAALVSSGTLTPEQISQMDEETRSTYRKKT